MSKKVIINLIIKKLFSFVVLLLLHFIFILTSLVLLSARNTALRNRIDHSWSDSTVIGNFFYHRLSKLFAVAGKSFQPYNLFSFSSFLKYRICYNWIHSNDSRPCGGSDEVWFSQFCNYLRFLKNWVSYK